MSDLRQIPRSPCPHASRGATRFTKPSPTIVVLAKESWMNTASNIFAMLAVGAALIGVPPAQAASGRTQAADQPRSTQDAPPRPCARRDTYNDVHYVNCVPTAASQRSLLETIGQAVQQVLQ